MRHACLAVLAALALALPATAQEDAPKTLKAPRVASLPEGDAARDWAAAPALDLDLMAQSFVPPRGGGAVKSLRAQALHDGRELAVRLSWQDATLDKLSELSGRFGDACALQFPLDPQGAEPSPMMGHQGSAVNIWRWLAQGQTAPERRYPKAYSDWDRPRTLEKMLPNKDQGEAENLTAEGFGSLTRQDLGSLKAQGRHERGVWTVVLRRGLADPAGVALKAGTGVPVAFAVWDGASQERNGTKSITFWNRLELE